ncbi:N-acetylmuramoyl-L-alanine amidase [Deinococcus lacus]|uniref:N-acetylmuramoyl-L-alanine amidase n=1 Tax=Deinococcus lacus TaxID=392561 RepID=A0ABW1Y9L7_9DEIO
MKRRLAGAGLLAASALAAGLGLARAQQIEYGSLSLGGTPVQSARIYGAEYVSAASLRQIASVVREGPIMRVEGYGHTLLLPIDEDIYRATTSFNTVQMDAERSKARAATFLAGDVYLPLDTVARGFGATYRPGEFTMPPAALSSVSSRAGATSDRLVLDLTQDTDVVDELRGNDVHVVLRGMTGAQQRYTTRGAFVSNARVVQDGADLRLRFSLPKDSGYRVYKVIRPGSVRVVIDAGPGVERTSPALLDRVARPLIVLEPVAVPGTGRDFTLDVAKRAAQALTQAGWQVKLTREGSTGLGLDEKMMLARQSDVYVMLDLARFPVPGAVQGGPALYEQLDGDKSSAYVAALREGRNPAYASYAVGDQGGTRRLGQLLQTELGKAGIQVAERPLSKVLALSEAPHAALLFELGESASRMTWRPWAPMTTAHASLPIWRARWQLT